MKYRIVKVTDKDTEKFYVQHKILWFWTNVNSDSAYDVFFSSKEDAEAEIRKLKGTEKREIVGVY